MHLCLSYCHSPMDDAKHARWCSDRADLQRPHDIEVDVAHGQHERGKPVALQVADARPLVRSISCWALSRYAHWLASRAQQPGSGAAQLDEVLRVRTLHL